MEFVALPLDVIILICQRLDLNSLIRLTSLTLQLSKLRTYTKVVRHRTKCRLTLLLAQHKPLPHLYGITDLYMPPYEICGASYFKYNAVTDHYTSGDVYQGFKCYDLSDRHRIPRSMDVLLGFKSDRDLVKCCLLANEMPTLKFNVVKSSSSGLVYYTYGDPDDPCMCRVVVNRLGWNMLTIPIPILGIGFMDMHLEVEPKDAKISIMGLELYHDQARIILTTPVPLIIHNTMVVHGCWGPYLY
jgi:hypothetical protein